MSTWPFSKAKPDEDGWRIVKDVINELLTFASDKTNAEFLDTAKEKYEGKMGRFYQDESDYIQRMNTFLEWFVFDFRTEELGSNTIFNRYINDNRDRLSSDELTLRMTIAKHLHSIFIVKNFKEGMVKVKDLYQGKSIWVTDDKIFEKGDMMESRVISAYGGNFFSYTYCLHPRSAASHIKAELKKQRKTGLRDDFFLKLRAMQLKWRRSRQIEIKDIYKF